MTGRKVCVKVIGANGFQCKKSSTQFYCVLQLDEEVLRTEQRAHSDLNWNEKLVFTLVDTENCLSASQCLCVSVWKCSTSGDDAVVGVGAISIEDCITGKFSQKVSDYYYYHYHMIEWVECLVRNFQAPPSRVFGFWKTSKNMDKASLLLCPYFGRTIVFGY